MTLDEPNELDTERMLSLSDEEFEKQSFDLEKGIETEEPVKEENTPEEEVEKDDEATEEEESPAEETNLEEESEEETSEEEEEAEGAEQPIADESEEEDSEEESDERIDSEGDSDKSRLADLDKIFAPFKANGAELKVKNADEVITLMQQGANYNKKMAGLKPSLNAVKMLEKHGLLDPAKLNVLIEAHNKSSGAIQHLAKEAGLDPMDMDMEDTTPYRAPDHSISDIQSRFDAEIENISSSEHYTKVLDVLGKQWDTSSQERISAEPEIISRVHDHVAQGYFDIISAEVARQKSFGQLTNVNDFDAYEQVGQQLYEAGAFDQTPKPATKQVRPSDTEIDKSKIDKKRKAVGSTKTVVTKAKKVDPDFNPLNMSDEEFEKQFSSKLQ